MTLLMAWRFRNSNKNGNNNQKKTRNTFYESPSSSSSTSSSTLESYKVLVKPRNRVSFDSDTGRYQVLDQVETSFQNPDKQKGGAWNALKQTFYSAVDVRQRLPSLPRRNSRRRNRPSVLEDGYSSIERAILTGELASTTTSTPGERLVQQYEQRTTVKATPPITTAVAADDRLADANALTTKPSSLSAFEKFKMGVYTTLDVTAKLFPKKDEDDNLSSTTTIDTMQLPVQSTLGTSQQVREALPYVTSDNPIQRYQALRQIRAWQEQQQRQRQYKLTVLKQTIYDVGDKAQAALDASVTVLPAVVQETAAATKTFVQWVSSIPPTIDQGLQTITRLPGQVEQTITTWQNAVASTVNTTTQMVQELQTIPTTVQQVVQDTTQAVGEVVTSAKVLVGLEQPKPKPPKVLPPTTTTPTTPLGWKVAGMLATSTAQVAWWAGKGVAWMTWKSIELAWNNRAVVEQQARALLLNQERPENVMTTVSTTPSSSLLGNKNDKNLERDVQEALEEALRQAKDDGNDDQTFVSAPLMDNNDVTWQGPGNNNKKNNVTKSEL
jgi:hypothetical protein